MINAGESPQGYTYFRLKHHVIIGDSVTDSHTGGETGFAPRLHSNWSVVQQRAPRAKYGVLVAYKCHSPWAYDTWVANGEHHTTTPCTTLPPDQAPVLEIY